MLNTVAPPGAGAALGARRRYLPEMLLAAVSVLLCLALLAGLELAARASAASAGGSSRRDGIYDGHRYSERLGWEPRPGARFVVDGAPTTINTHGYRGDARPREPGAGRERVVLVGDSVAFGYGVADDHTFAHLLDPARERFETVNLAVPGYGVDQSLLRYELSGSRWHPHVVVLNLCVDNDLADIMLPVFLYDGQHPKPRFELRNGVLELHDSQLRLNPPARLGLWLSERSHLYRRLAWGRSRDVKSGALEHWSARRRRVLEKPWPAVNLMAALVGRLRQNAERDGARLALVIHPNKAGYRGGPRWVERLTSKPALRGLQIVRLADAYREQGLTFGHVAADGIGHLSPQGHRIAARALRAALEAWSPAAMVDAAE